MSATARTMFGSANVFAQGKALLRMVHVVAKAAEDPVQGSLMLRKQAVQHLMYVLSRQTQVQQRSVSDRDA